MEPPLAGAESTLRLRLIGLTDLHANLYPYDYYRDRPDDAVGLARAASLIAAGAAANAPTVSCSTTATFSRARRSATSPRRRS